MGRPHIEYIQAQALPWQRGLNGGSARPDVESKILSLDSDDGGVTFTAPRAVASSNDGSGRGTPGFATLVVSQAGSIHVARGDRLGGHVATWQDP